jgi:murein DD-endopeptidase MepM/ murein hydrolase activator NlpD
MSAFSAGRRAHRPARPARPALVGIALACCLGLVGSALSVAPAALASPSSSVSAVPGAQDPNKAKREIDKEIDALRNQLDDTSVSLQNAYIALRRTQAALPAAQAKVDQTTAALNKADAYNDAMAVALGVAQANEARAEDELAATRKNLSDSRTRVARFASQLYQDQGMGQLSVALSATTPEDFANRIELTDAVMDVQNQSLNRLATAQAAATSQEAHIKALRVQVAAAKKAAEVALAKATTARATAAAAKAKLDALAAQLAAQSRSLAAQMTAEKAKLAKAQREQARLSAILKARARAAKLAAARRAAALRRAHKPVPQSPSAGGFLSPPSNAWISSEFGMRFHPILHYWRLHAGRDYAGACGSPIYAAANGTVISAGWGGGYGNRVMIDHGIVGGVDLVTTYNHMSRIVARGGHIRRGQIVGYVGTTGESTGCHLHFETYEDGVPKDPRRWL